MRDVEVLLMFIHSCGYNVRGGELWRPDEMQAIYVKTGRSKTMNGQHPKKCAIDLHILLAGQIVYPEEVGRFWEALSPENRAGMFFKSFKDGPHFERYWR